MGGTDRGGAGDIDMLEELAAGVAVENERLVPARAVGRDLEVEMIISHRAELGAARIAGLEEE